jgi:hypothetical protein
MGDGLTVFIEDFKIIQVIDYIHESFFQAYQLDDLRAEVKFVTVIDLRPVAGGKNQRIAQAEKLSKLQKNTMAGFLVQRNQFSDLNRGGFIG